MWSKSSNCAEALPDGSQDPVTNPSERVRTQAKEALRVKGQGAGGEGRVGQSRVRTMDLPARRVEQWPMKEKEACIAR